MPPLKREVKHRIIREDALAAATTAKSILETTARSLPATVLIIYTLTRIMEPIPGTANPWDETRKRLLAVQMPIVSVLAIMYQGPLGGLSISIASAVGILIAPFRFHKNAKGEWVLDVLDAAMAATYLPIILEVLRGEGKERGGIL